ncbi:MAG: DUF1684 domain-containing protein [Gemmatimonadota bacterium]|nr:DUF1684 domain-containing protein [Gemmatimonadota bacterium]
MRAPLALAFVALGVLAACERQLELPPVDATVHRAATVSWQEAQRGDLSARGAPLAYTGLDWLHAGANSIGSDSSNDIVLVGHGVPARVGALVREGNRVRFEAVPGATASIDAHPAHASNDAPLRTDADSGKSSRVQVGSAGFRLIKRLDAIGVRRWDDERPAYLAFRGAHYFDDDVHWRIGGKFEPYAVPKIMRVQTESGIEQDLRIVGTVRTSIDGERYDLTAFAGDSAQDLWIVFKDATNGRESYGFRYMKAARDTATNLVTLDFNRGYNPDCAYTPYATCPLPPPANRIRVRIPAGERVYEPAIATRK